MSSESVEKDSTSEAHMDSSILGLESDDHEKEMQKSMKSKTKREVTWSAPDGTFSKTVLKDGQGYLRPFLESTCTLDISYVPFPEVESDSPLNAKVESLLQSLGFPLGQNLELSIGMAETEAVRVVENCITTMRKGEISEFALISRLYDAQLQSELKDNCSNVLLRVVLHSFSEVKPIWELTSEEKYNLALSHKERGSNLFRDGQAEAAFYQYSVAVKYLICIPECTVVTEEELEPEETSKVEMFKALKCICFLNLAACQAKVENHNSVIKNCTHALELDSANVKGLYRRAQAYKASGKLEEARSDLKQALKFEPRNRAVASLLQSCKS